MVKDKLEESPARRRRNGGGGVIIRERRQPSPLCQREWTPPPEYKAAATIIKAEDGPEEFPGLRQDQLESFVATDEFSEACNAAYHRRAEEERRRRLGLVINLNDNEADSSNRPRGRRGDVGQECSPYLPQPKEEEPDDGEDYAATMYHRLGLARDGSSC
jgi:hypothetical protein